MAGIKDKAKQIWEAIILPDGVDEEYDERCDKAFSKTVDYLINFGYTVFFVMSIISLYFLITREIL
tara:strand:- start:168 stop:365 length:198 start_codon:yes stop_codon:yes gene_type:complete